MESDEEIRNRFSYHAPIGAQTKAYEEIRAHALAYAQRLVTLCSESRELTLALTHLDEVVMFANASIARHGLRE